jgi:RNA-directed DNA polymerase
VTTGLPKTYPLDQSPLYRLRSRRRLANLFHSGLKELESLARRQDNYWKFSVNGKTDKSRHVQTPKPILERLHRRLFNLLTRIETPSYLHSGVRGRSYVSNAAEHVDARELIKVDIVRFFPSTSRLHVFRFFHEKLRCSQDVAGVLSRLCTVDEHLPTGSCISQVMAFWSHKDVFDDIHQIARDNRLKMTCYVDDITLSGERVRQRILHEVRRRIRQQGLLTHSSKHKERRYAPTEPKLVTGVVIANGELRMPNRLHKRVHEARLLLGNANLSPETKADAIQRAIHTLRSASQIDPQFKQRANWLSHKARELDEGG